MVMSMNINPVSLFDSKTAWSEQGALAFADLLASDSFRRSNRSSVDLPLGHRVKRETSVVYLSMFEKFSRCLRDRQKNVVSASKDDFIHFMDEVMGNSTAETRARYIRLLERVYIHLQLSGFIDVNPITEWLIDMRETGANTRARRVHGPTLKPEKAEVLQDWMYIKGSKAIEDGDWKLARDLTIASICLGAGLRCTEIVRLQRKQIKYWPGGRASERIEVDIPAWASVKTSRAHRTTVGRGGVDLMEKWFLARWKGFKNSATEKTILIPGDILFPSTANGKPLASGTLFVNLKEYAKKAVDDNVLDEGSRWILETGAQGLRRAYALTTLQTGSDPDLLVERMGLWHKRSMRRYQEDLVSAERRNQ